MRVSAPSTFPDQIHTHVTEGNVTGARRAISQTWRESVTDTPVRFQVILQKVSGDEVLKLAERARKGKKIGRLKLRFDGIDAEVLSSKGVVLGFVPSGNIQLLIDLDADVKAYKPRLLEIKVTESGGFDYIAVELVRPEKAICPSCSNEHMGVHLLCDDCRDADKRGRGADAEQDKAPVLFAEAVEALLADDA
jgi:hypothetical protein